MAISKAKPKEKPYKLPDEKGLFVLVHPNGGKYWRLKYRYKGKEKTLALGTFPEVTQAEARDGRNEARRIWLKGLILVPPRSKAVCPPRNRQQITLKPSRVNGWLSILLAVRLVIKKRWWIAWKRMFFPGSAIDQSETLPLQTCCRSCN